MLSKPPPTQLVFRQQIPSGNPFENQSIHLWPDKSVLFQRTFIVALRTRVRVYCLPDSR